MIAAATNAIHAPIQAKPGPRILTNDQIEPLRVALPIPNSRISSGTDQARRKTTQATKNDPPPLLAAMRGNLQIFPVPTAIPSIARSMPQRELKTSDFDDTSILPRVGCERVGNRPEGLYATRRCMPLPEPPVPMFQLSG